MSKIIVVLIVTASIIIFIILAFSGNLLSKWSRAEFEKAISLKPRPLVGVIYDENDDLYYDNDELVRAQKLKIVRDLISNAKSANLIVIPRISKDQRSSLYRIGRSAACDRATESGVLGGAQSRVKIGQQGEYCLEKLLGGYRLAPNTPRIAWLKSDDFKFPLIDANAVMVRFGRDTLCYQANIGHKTGPIQALGNYLGQSISGRNALTPSPWAETEIILPDCQAM